MMDKLLYLHRNKCLPPGAVALYLPTEEGRNLIKFSQQFDNAAWFKTRTTIVPNAAIAPDGTMTADKLVETVANDSHSVGCSEVMPGTVSIQFTFSVYLKAAERTSARLSLARNTISFGFDLATGQLLGPSGAITGAIQDVGDGWYRCSVTALSHASVTGEVAQVYLAVDGSRTYVSDDVSGVYIWGAQIEQGSVATTYYPTTDKQILKDYANRSRNLLLPNQANGGEDGTVAGFVSILTGITLSSDATEHWQGSRSIKVAIPVPVLGGGVQTYLPGCRCLPDRTYTISGYIKGATGTVRPQLYCYTDAGSYITRIEGGLITLNGEWQRFVITSVTPSTCRVISMGVLVSGTAQALTFYIDGLQIEEGAVATEWQAPPNHGVLGSALGADTNDPTWTGQGLAFTTDDYATIPELLAGATEATVIMAMNVTADVAAAGYLSISGSDENPSLFTLSLRRGAAPGPSGDFLNLSVSDGTARTGLDTNLVGIDGGTSQYRAVTARYVGGTKMDLGFAPGPYALQTTAVPATLNAAPLGMMTIGRSDASNLTGGMAALGVWRRHLSDAEVAQAYAHLKGYLAKFGVMLQ